MTIVEQRAAARIAWRYARKAKARTALILFLIALPIAALVGAGVIINTVVANPEDTVTRDMGSADLSFIFPSTSTGATLAKVLPVGSVVNESKSHSAYKVAGGTLYTVDVIQNSMPSDQAPTAAQYRLTGGHMPHSSGEAAMSPSLARGLGVHIGDVVQLDGVKRALTLVGLAWNRFNLRDGLVVVGPRTLNNKEIDQDSFFVVLPRAAELASVEDSLIRAQVGFLDRAQARREDTINRSRFTGLSFAGAIVALFATGMIVVTAFGVGARRQLRAYGLVASSGGEPRHVHAIVLWGGIWLGAVGSVIGVVVAIVSALTLRPHLNSLANRIVESARIPWVVVVGGIVLGTLAATLAARAPARQAAQVSALDALAGRSPNPRPPGRLARRGFVGVLVGCLFTVVATLSHEWTLLGIALVVTLTGFLFTIPMLVTFVGRFSARLPAISRLAARQTARYGRRTGAAVAAATIALTVPIALSSMILSSDAENNVRFLGNDQVMLSSYVGQSGVPQNMVDAARLAIPDSVLGQMRFADTYMSQDRSLPPEQNEQPAQVTGPPQSPTRSTVGAVSAESPLAVADAALMQAAHAEEGIKYLNGDRLIAVGLPTDNGVLHLQIQGIAGPIGSSVPAGSGAGVPVPAYQPTVNTYDVKAVAVSGGIGEPYEIPHYFIPANLLKKFGLHPGAVTQVLLRSPHPLTKADVARVKHAVGLIPGGVAEAQSDLVRDTTGTRLAITGGAIGLALIIVAVAVALVGAESRREQAILSAVGATPGVRRRLVGANALLMTALASLLAVPSALIPMNLILHARHRPAPTPWTTLGFVIVAPLVAGLMAALVSRAPKARAMLQPNW